MPQYAEVSISNDPLINQISQMTLRSGLGHPNVVKPWERIGGATVWSFAEGQPWNSALRHIGLETALRCKAGMIAMAPEGCTGQSGLVHHMAASDCIVFTNPIYIGCILGLFQMLPL